jgi:hypothetical protein
MINIVSFEPTPSPNVMKLSLAEMLPAGVRYQFEITDWSIAPEPFCTLLHIEGVKSVYATADFIALERRNGADWRSILVHVPGIDESQLNTIQRKDKETAQLDSLIATSVEEEYLVLVQKIANIPMQVKLTGNSGEYRFAMPEYIVQSAVESSKKTANMIVHREWHEIGARYGVALDLGPLLVAEQTAIHAHILPVAQNSDAPEAQNSTSLTSWQERYARLNAADITEENMNLFASALRDAHPSVRRLAVVLIGELKQPLYFTYLFKALRDPAISVRRTAGDTLSDLGDPLAVPYMVEALADSHKLMRWRAARFLYECGDASAIPALTTALSDKEFEVSLQAKLALERIVAGSTPTGTMWQQMTNRSKNVQ